jgi:uncharacterized membrane protein
VVSYTFTISNTGDYTDTYALSVTSAWTATLSAESTGALGAGESVAVVLTVAIPAEALAEASEIATLTATSGLDGDVSASATAATTVVLTDFKLYQPLILR